MLKIISSLWDTRKISAVYLPALGMSVVLLASSGAQAQTAGGDLGGGASIFRAKNPTVKKAPAPPARGGRTPPARTTAASSTRREERAPAPTGAALEERLDDALEAGNAARDRREFAAAEKSYRQALRLKKNDWRAAYGLGNIYADQRQWAQAETFYRQAAVVEPRNVDVLTALSFVLTQSVTGGDYAKRLSEAEAVARRAVGADANDAQAHNRLGIALSLRGVRNAETETEFRRAIELDPKLAVANLYLAQLAQSQGKRGESEQYYTRAGELAQGAQTLTLIAETLADQQRWEQAEQVARRALAEDERNPGALFVLGRALLALQRFADAEPVLQKAVAVSPRSFAPHHALGSVYLRLNRPQDAEAAFGKAAAIANTAEKKQLAGAFGFGGVGDAYAKLGQTKDALRAYERALVLDPENPGLKARSPRCAVAKKTNRLYPQCMILRFP